MSFFKYYFKLDDVDREQAVNCPFPHHTASGVSYFETHPSAQVNLKEKLFHCKVCGDGHNETSFIKKLLACTYANATRLSKAFNNYETLAEWERDCGYTLEAQRVCADLKISDAVAKELRITSPALGSIAFPVFLYDKLVDVRTYTPGGGDQKIRSRSAAPYGMLIPNDIDKIPMTKTILLCAGEKDMATTRSHGFKAYTLTGGEGTLPLAPMWFKDRNVVILYDNDDAGKLGAVKLASSLLGVAHSVKACTSFHQTCTLDKEDMTDYWNKYQGTREQLIAYMDQTPEFTEQDAITNINAPLISLQEATTPEHINKLVRSNIQVAAISEVQYVLPGVLLGEKLKAVDDSDSMMTGEVKEWELSDNNLCDVLHLVDNGFKEEDINKNAKALMKIPMKEKYIRITKHNKLIVYKAYVTEMIESINTDTMPMEYVAYSIGNRLESGKKYMVTHKLVPHPYKGQQLVMLITDAVHANDSVNNFKVTPEVVNDLKAFQEVPGDVTERMEALVHKVKGILGYDGNDMLIKTIDLAYHTVLTFNFGTFKEVRGYLDTLVVGESRVGKSSTADALRRMYELGAFTSLAGNSATIPGLVGGSNKTSGGAYQTKAGLLPQNHKGLVIFEEFGKCNSNITAELTDIRSSNEVRITRVSGTLSLPAMVRMILLPNVKATNGEIKSIASYPNGISIVTELVPTAEDIARYDVLAVLGDRGTATIDPYWEPDTPMTKEQYQSRVRWVWSRSSDQVLINPEVGRHIIDKSNELNRDFDCHIKIFGTEAWKKIARLAIAIAGYLVSTDPTYQNIVVLKEHVDYAVSMYRELYDNHVFRLKEYVLNERKYNSIDDIGINDLQLMYAKVPALLNMLEQEARPSRNSLLIASGIDQNQFNGAMNQLVRGSFVRLSGNDVLPTERYRLGMSHINRQINAERLGVNDA